MGHGLNGGQLHLLAGTQILDSGHAGADLVLSQKDDIGDSQLIGIGNLLLEFFLFPVDLGTDTGIPHGGGQRDGGGEVLGHGQDEHVGGGGVQILIQIALILQNEEQAGQADGNSNSGELFIGIIFRQVIISAAGTDGTDFRMVQHGGLVDGSGVVIQPTGDGQVHGKVALRHAKGGQVLCDGPQFVQSSVKERVTAPIALQSGKDFSVTALDGDEFQDLIGLVLGEADVLPSEEGGYLLPADLVQLVHGTHDVSGLVCQPQHGVKAIEDLPVIHPDLEAPQAHFGKGLIDDGGDLRLVGDVQFAIANNVDVRLIELPESAPLGPLSPIDLANLEAAEGKGELAIVLGYILGQGNGQVKAEGQIRVPLHKAVDLFFCLSSSLGQQHLARLDEWGIQGGEAIERVSFAQNGRHPLKLGLLRRQQLHKAGQGAGLYFAHGIKILSLVEMK